MITDRQRDMLTRLDTDESMSITGMVAALNVNRSGQVAQNLSYNFDQLCLKGLAELDTARATRLGKGYLITQAGLDALRAESVQAGAYTHRRISLMHQPTYQPPAWVCTRNETTCRA